MKEAHFVYLEIFIECNGKSASCFFTTSSTENEEQDVKIKYYKNVTEILSFYYNMKNY